VAGGERSALLMQSSGVGNCVNMFTLATHCAFPLLMLVTMRGEWGEFNPWQVPMGQATQETLARAGVRTYRLERARSRRHRGRRGAARLQHQRRHRGADRAAHDRTKTFEGSK